MTTLVEVYFTEWSVDADGDADREVCFTLGGVAHDGGDIAARCGRIVRYADGQIDVTMYGDERFVNAELGEHTGVFVDLIEAERWAADTTRKRGEAMLRRTAS